jgi:hypothetical protein
MNKFVKSFVILAVIAIAFGSAGAVFAQTETPEDEFSASTLRYNNLSSRSGRGGNGTMLRDTLTDTQDGLLHDEMIAAYSEALGISVDELNARLEAGETMAEIAISTGLTVEAFQEIMLEVRAIVLDQAVIDGLMTEEQAEWLKTRGAGLGNLSGARRSSQRMYNRGLGDCLVD